jgi:hypothetical protein
MYKLLTLVMEKYATMLTDNTTKDYKSPHKRERSYEYDDTQDDEVNSKHLRKKSTEQEKRKTQSYQDDNINSYSCSRYSQYDDEAQSIKDNDTRCWRENEYLREENMNLKKLLDREKV